jgi:hypothetical protein
MSDARDDHLMKDPKRPYEAPRLRDLGSVPEVTTAGTIGGGAYDGTGYPAS